MKTTGVPDAWKQALLNPLAALLFDGVQEHAQDAWDQAIALILMFAPKTEQEFRLVVRMSILNLQANFAAQLAKRSTATIGQALRAQANVLALTKAADKAEARFKQLQSARLQRAKAAEQQAPQEPASEPTPEPTVAAAKPAPDITRTAKDEARAISDYARKNNMSYPQAWALHQRDKKAAQPQQSPITPAVQTT